MNCNNKTYYPLIILILRIEYIEKTTAQVITAGAL